MTGEPEDDDDASSGASFTTLGTSVHAPSTLAKIQALWPRAASRAAA